MLDRVDERRSLPRVVIVDNNSTANLEARVVAAEERLAEAKRATIRASMTLS